MGESYKMLTRAIVVTVVDFIDVSFTALSGRSPRQSQSKLCYVTLLILFRKIEDLQFSIEEASIDENDFKVSMVNVLVQL